MWKIRVSIGMDVSEISGVDRGQPIVWLFLYVNTFLIFAPADLFLELQSNWLKAQPNNPILTQSPEKDLSSNTMAF